MQEAQEAKIDPTEVYKIIQCESGWNVDAIGDHGTSYGLVQIHLPAHPEITVEEAEDPRFAVDFLVSNLKSGNGHLWSCYNELVQE